MTEPTPRDRVAPSLSRRTVTRAAAWSLPVIAAAAATPLSAASTSTGVRFGVLTEPVNVKAGDTFGGLVLQVTDDWGQPLSGGTLTPQVSGAGSMLAAGSYPIVDGIVSIPSGVIRRTAGDTIADDVVVTGTYTSPAGATRPVSLLTLHNHEVVRLFHDQDSLATTGVDWTLRTRPALRTTVFADFFIRPRIEAGPRRSKAAPTSAIPVQWFTPPLQVKVTATNGHWGAGTTITQNDGVIDKHNGEHRLAYLYQDSTTGPVIVEGYADYPTGIGSETRRAHIRMTWPTAGQASNSIEQWQTWLP